MADVPTPTPTATPVDTTATVEPIIRLEDVSLFYGSFRAVRRHLLSRSGRTPSRPSSVRPAAARARCCAASTA